MSELKKYGSEKLTGNAIVGFEYLLASGNLFIIFSISTSYHLSNCFTSIIGVFILILSFINLNLTYEFNNYNNNDLDELISRTLIEMDPQKRLTDLQEALRIVTEEDVIGVPLFQYEIVYAMLKEIHYPMRIDTLIYFNELSLYAD